MKIAVMQPYFFPYIGYWQLINAVDKFVIYDDVNYINRGWINRNRILMKGEAKTVNLIMNGASQNKHINQIQASGEKKHQKKFLRTIEEAYCKAPYFSSAYPLVESIMSQNERNLAKFLEVLINELCRWLGIETELIVSSDIPKNNSLTGQDKIVEICRLLGADSYFNPIGGRELYSVEEFSSKGIDLKFLEPKTVTYKQFSSRFIPDLSIVDVMMFNSAEGTKGMLKEFEILKA